MNTECISNIELKTNNKEIISVPQESFKNFYISNVDDNGDEINYTPIEHSSTLCANFFIVKVLKNENPLSNNIIDRVLKKKDIIKLGINFKNGAYQEFELSKKRVVEKGLLQNKYEEAFLDQDNNLCILISDKNLKYKKELFA